MRQQYAGDGVARGYEDEFAWAALRPSFDPASLVPAPAGPAGSWRGPADAAGGWPVPASPELADTAPNGLALASSTPSQPARARPMLDGPMLDWPALDGPSQLRSALRRPAGHAPALNGWGLDGESTAADPRATIAVLLIFLGLFCGVGAWWVHWEHSDSSAARAAVMVSSTRDEPSVPAPPWAGTAG